MIGSVQVETLKSNDEGVAFLVTAEGRTIYHAGDLNWWYWNGEPEDDNEFMVRFYKGSSPPEKEERSILHFFSLIRGRRINIVKESIIS